MFAVLDQPDPNVSCERRDITTVPTQALTLLNDEFVLLQARYFAERVQKAAGDDPAAQVKAAYRIALSREPTPAELQTDLAFMKKELDHYATRGSGSSSEASALANLKVLTGLTDVILNLSEFFTKIRECI